MDREKLIEQVKLNCNISDAKYWGYYSICGMLLRLRYLYRTEHSMKPWQRIPPEDITPWIAEREALWEKLQHMELQPIEIEGELYDPFSFEQINERLNPEGLVYGGGYGMFNKPTFFLAEIEEIGDLYDYRVYYTTRELCRDLSYSAAMLQGRCIFIRHEPLLIMLWEKMLQLKGGRTSEALKRAFRSYGIEPDTDSEHLYRRLEDLCKEVRPLLLYHELGEAFEDESQDQWLCRLQQSGTEQELYLRALKDALADTSDFGPLRYIIQMRDTGLLHFFIAMLEYDRKEILKELLTAYEDFLNSKDWEALEIQRKKLYNKVRSLYLSTIGS